MSFPCRQESSCKGRTLACPQTLRYLLLSLLLYPSLLFAQPEDPPKIRKSDLHLGFMSAIGVGADAIYANVYKTPLLLGGQLGYSYQGRLMRHSVYLRSGAGWLLSPYRTAGKVFGYSYPAAVDLPFDVLLSYNLTFTLWQKRNLHFRLGPGVHFSANGWLANDSDFLRYAWLVHSGLGLKLFFGWQPAPRHKLTFGLYLALLNIGWRPPYQGYTLKEEALVETKGILAAMFSSPQFLFLHNLLDLTLNAAYQYALTPFLDLRVEYQLRVVYTAAVRARMEWQNYVVFGVSFRF